MKKELPRSVFYTAVGLVVLIAGVLLYRQATEPLYHRDPNAQRFVTPAERRQRGESLARPEPKSQNKTSDSSAKKEAKR